MGFTSAFEGLNLTVHILTTRLNVVTMRNAVPVPINYSPSARRKQTRRIWTRRIETAFHTLQALDPIFVSSSKRGYATESTHFTDECLAQDQLHYHNWQVRHCTYNVTLRSNRATFVAVGSNEYYTTWVRVFVALGIQHEAWDGLGMWRV